MPRSLITGLNGSLRRRHGVIDTNYAYSQNAPTVEQGLQFQLYGQREIASGVF